MRIRRKLPIAALVVFFGALGLSGCGAEEKTSPSDAQGTTTQPQESEASPPEEPEGSNAPVEGSGGDDSGGDNSGGDKPSRADVAEGFLGIAEQALGSEFPKDYADQAAECVVDNIYDRVTATTLNAIAGERLSAIEKADFPAFAQANQVCGEQFGN